MSTPFTVGDRLAAERPLLLSKARIAEFAVTSGDASIVHLDDDAARAFGFPRALAHGLLGMTLAHRLLSEHFPQQSIKRFSARFVAMTFVNDVLRCDATVTGLGEATGELELSLRAVNQKDEVVMTGGATIAPSSDKGGQFMTVSQEEMVSEWLRVDQDMISQFGDLTLDPDPMHNDPEWADANGPYGGSIAYGFLTISLLSHLIRLARTAAGQGGGPREGYALNYGFDRLRLVSPVPTGARIRGRFTLMDSHVDEKGRRRGRYDCAVEVEGQERPALVAQWLTIFVPVPALSH